MKITLFTSNDLRHRYLIELLNKNCSELFVVQEIMKFNKNNFPILRGSSKIKKKFLNSDLYIVFGSSFIRGELFNFLYKKKAINIHMGVSPYYRGTDCNFWSVHDKNYHLTGATIHRLTLKLDQGPILYYAFSNQISKNLFIYTMSCVYSAFMLLIKLIKSKKINQLRSYKQNLKLEIKYSKKKDFTDEVIKTFLNRDDKIKKIQFKTKVPTYKLNY